MPNNLSIKDASAATQSLKTTETTGVHTPHHIVDGTVAVTGPLTDTQLRATAVPVSGTFWQATQPVSGTVGISGTVPVSGTFWQTTQPVSGSVTGLSDKGSVSEASTQSITTGGTHQQVFTENSSRKYLLIQNISDTDMYLGLGFNPSNTTPAGLLLAKSGGGIVFESSYIPTSEVRIVCATTGKRFVALQG